MTRRVAAVVVERLGVWLSEAEWQLSRLARWLRGGDD